MRNPSSPEMGSYYSSRKTKKGMRNPFSLIFALSLFVSLLRILLLPPSLYRVWFFWVWICLLYGWRWAGLLGAEAYLVCTKSCRSGLLGAQRRVRFDPDKNMWFVSLWQEGDNIRYHVGGIRFFLVKKN